MILGKQKYLETVVLKEGDGLFDIKERIIAKTETIGLDENIIFVDLFGATPFNAASLLCADTGYPVVAGISLPVLLEFLSGRDSLKACEMEEVLKEMHHSSFHFIKQDNILNNN